jgi:hypothetical protein
LPTCESAGDFASASIQVGRTDVSLVDFRPSMADRRIGCWEARHQSVSDSATARSANQLREWRPDVETAAERSGRDLSCNGIARAIKREWSSATPVKPTYRRARSSGDHSR